MIIDISQEVLSSVVFPGDPAPSIERLCSIQHGDVCNLTAFSMCAHNGTHVDAPFHFIEEGKKINQIELDVFVGECYVVGHEGEVTAEDALSILKKARAVGAWERILIAGKATVTEGAAKVFADAQIKLIGNESQTVGPEDAPMEVHKILLGADIVLLEGVVLTDVRDGKYFLNAVPLNLAGCDGSPCRAILIEGDSK